MTDRSLRILVSGWRGATMAEHGTLVRLQLAGTVNLYFPDIYSRDRAQPEPITLIHGRCHLGGVDLLADVAARSFRWGVEQYPAEQFGPWPQCGPQRNRYMCSLGADLLIAWPYPGSKGTIDCIIAAVEYGIPTIVHPLPRSMASAHGA